MVLSSRNDLATAVVTRTRPRKQWFEIYQNLTNARGEIEQAHFLIETLRASLPAGAAVAHNAGHSRFLGATASHCCASETRTVEFGRNKDFRALRVAPLAVGRRSRLLSVSCGSCVSAGDLVLADNGTLMFDYVPSAHCGARSHHGARARRLCARAGRQCRAASAGDARAGARSSHRCLLWHATHCAGAGTDWRAAASRSPPSRTASSTATICWCARVSRCGSSACFCSWCARRPPFRPMWRFWPRIVARASIVPSALCSALPTMQSRSRSRLNSSPALKATVSPTDVDDECAQTSLRRRWRRRRRTTMHPTTAALVALASILDNTLSRLCDGVQRQHCRQLARWHAESSAPLSAEDEDTRVAQWLASDDESDAATPKALPVAFAAGGRRLRAKFATYFADEEETTSDDVPVSLVKAVRLLYAQCRSEAVVRSAFSRLCRSLCLATRCCVSGRVAHRRLRASALFMLATLCWTLSK
jgi:hypothetical protein